MKRILFLLIISCLTTFSALAKAPLKSIEAYYSYFEDNYSVKQWLNDVQKMALWLSEKGEEGVAEFNKEINRFWVYDTFHIWAMVLNCETNTALSHPNPANRKVVVNVNGLGKKVKDHAGKLIIVEGCVKANKFPKGSFISTFSTWCVTKTGLGPMYAQMLSMKVPKTDYVLLSWLPLRANSIDEVDKAANGFNELVEGWSIIQ